MNIRYHVELSQSERDQLTGGILNPNFGGQGEQNPIS